jgi:hypothetical protein
MCKSRKTGEAGKKINIGRITKPGAFRISSAKEIRDIRLKGINIGILGETEEMMNKDTESDAGMIQYSFSRYSNNYLNR